MDGFERRDLSLEDDAYRLSELFESLVCAATHPHDFIAPIGWGVYAWFLDGEELCGLPIGQAGLLYIGRSNDLADREIKQHLSVGGTPASSLRRSLGALLRCALTLEAILRSDNVNDRKRFSHYAFTVTGEEALTRWMYEHLKVAALIKDDPEDYEPLLIKHKRPVLNLTHWPNPHRKAIKALRRICADEARASRG
jgi:hypothetical protein